MKTQAKFKVKLITESSNEVLFEGIGNERIGLVSAARTYLEHARIHSSSWPEGLTRSLRVKRGPGGIEERLIQQTFEWTDVPGVGASYVSIQRLYY